MGQIKVEIYDIFSIDTLNMLYGNSDKNVINDIDVRIVSIRTPRKLKNKLKKIGAYVNKRVVNIPSSKIEIETIIW